jgi:hypothetical protein
MTTVTDQPTGLRAYAVRRPVTTYLLIVLGLGLPLLAGATLLGLEQDPFLLLVTYAGLTGAALVLTRWTQGPG